MPFPLLIPVVMGAAAVLGAGKTVKAAVDNNEANDINNQADRIIRRSNEQLEAAKKLTNDALEDLGTKKLQAYSRDIKDFVTEYSKIKNIELKDSQGLSEVTQTDFSKETLAELNQACNLAMETLSGGAAALGGGALAAFGAYSGTMMFASASTGTAISTLGGAAATNATLAWLGGGALSAGGMGIAGGTMVLGSLVAGPALLIFGGVLGAKADQKLSEAKSNREMAWNHEEEIKLVSAKLNQIQTGARFTENLLSKLRTRQRRANKSMASAIAQYGTNWNDYPKEQKEVIFAAVKSIQLIKTIIDTPLLSQEGALEDNSIRTLHKIEAELN
ncbi:hypothetical protein [Halodesulfovibrio sp.]|uniref:hypothetical protein n=1 Tax=Halodesulfovibrio sp. TaxID=1912772 RepID=UPI0025C54B4D|nr:hypothetical protein [Halodesulfovibrio sp.]